MKGDAIFASKRFIYRRVGVRAAAGVRGSPGLPVLLAVLLLLGVFDIRRAPVDQRVPVCDASASRFAADRRLHP
jgi:hypothetical protein